MKGNLKKGIPTIITLGGSLLAALGSAYNRKRKNRQEELQARVNATAPTPIEKDDSVKDDNIQLSVIEDNQVDLRNCQESPMSENEIKEWEALISTIGGETIKTALTTSAFNGLLRCDVPLKDLCRIKGEPNAMRGFIINDGKISRHAAFSEVKWGNVTPLLAYQCAAIITSQYYQQIITDRLNSIDKKIDNLFKIDEAEKRAKLKAAYERLVSLKAKTKYDSADKTSVLSALDKVKEVREQYRELLSTKGPFNVDYSLFHNKKEAERKIKDFKDSRYFEYLEITMQAEALSFIALAVFMKIAMFFRDEEDIKFCANNMNLDYWNNYVDQFNRIKHDVVKYLELEASDSLIHKKSITLMKEAQLQRFNKVEKAMLELQKQFEHPVVLYIKQEHGELKKYIPLSES